MSAKHFKPTIIIFCLLFAQTIMLHAQNMNPNKVFYPSYSQLHRKNLTFPDIADYTVLSCDFHTHTIFSDGLVWPTLRVDEAWKGGLDAMAITDHIEYRPFREFTNNDHNTSYMLALPEAAKAGLLLIKGTEITRKQSTIGHYNALFIEDANPIAVDDATESIKEAKKQGAFITWNHPGWAVDSTYIKSFQENLFKEGLIDGIEVFNNKEFYPVALSWAIDRNLTIIAASDVHGNVEQGTLTSEGFERPMTLVLAKERSIEGIYEALLQKRTLAFFHNKLAATEEMARLFTEHTLELKETFRNDKNIYIQITNKCSVPYNFTILDNENSLPANSSVIVTLPLDYAYDNKVDITFNNIFIYENKTLAHVLYFD